MSPPFFLTFQVVDAFCTSRTNLSGPKAVESVLAWSLRFSRLKGVEHLVAALKVVHAVRAASPVCRRLVVLACACACVLREACVCARVP